MATLSTVPAPKKTTAQASLGRVLSGQVSSGQVSSSQVASFAWARVAGGFSHLAALWHLTSLDAPTVAVTWALAFAWAVHISLPIWLPAILALTTWTIYIGDRLLDAKRAQHSLRARHHFHWRHHRIFVPVAIASALAALALVLYYMPIAARTRNSVLAAVTLAYFTGVHSDRRISVRSFFARIVPANFPMKELLVGVIFTLACAVPTLTRMITNRVEMLLPILCFIALAWLNCRAIEVWETAPERQLRSGRTFLAAMVLMSIALFSAGIAVGFHQLHAGALLASGALSAGLIGILDRNSCSLSPVMLRTIVDLVLLTPLILLAIG
ncbi:hypothetical protein [Acidicapsa ligni]|uniref:hypothetical protein n=1 Tax=Acidicapsa ligni TaxID=542300 RepID=UPI0021DF4246|nr:hypothetical protein [Acidicapsa ligni]